MDTEHLVPLKEFVARSIAGDWRVRDQFLIYSSPVTRFNVSVEHNTDWNSHGKCLARDDALSERGISPACSDAQELAQDLMNSVFYHCSPHELKHIADAIQDYLAKWEARREEDYKQHPEIFGVLPPPPIR